MALPSVKELLEEDLFKLLDIDKASDEQKQAIVQALINTVDARVINRVASLLSEDDAKEFEKTAEEGDSQGLVDFLVKKEIDLSQIVSEEATRARVEIVELSRLAKER